MTTEQLAKANELNKKIKEAKNYISNLQKQNEEVTTAGVFPVGLKVSYMINSTGKSFEFNPDWIRDAALRTEALNSINQVKDKMISLLNDYVVTMEKELEKI